MNFELKSIIVNCHDIEVSELRRERYSFEVTLSKNKFPMRIIDSKHNI